MNRANWGSITGDEASRALVVTISSIRPGLTSMKMPSASAVRTPS